MSEACERCPCPQFCLRRPQDCRPAAQAPPDPLALRGICDRGRIAQGLPAAMVAAEYPPLGRMAANLAGSFWDWAVSGFSMASDEEMRRRLAICAGCPEWVSAHRRCRVCGCFTDIKIRSRVEHCPLPEPRW